MNTAMTGKLLRALGAVAAAGALTVAALWAPARANADTGLTMTIGGPITLVNGVYLTVPVQVSCPASTPPFVLGTDDINVTIEQKTSKTIASGQGGIGFYAPEVNGGGGFGTPVTCDGTPQSYTVDVFPQVPGSGPFKGGRAVVQYASFDVGTYDSTDPCVYCTLTSSAVYLGPQPINIRG